MDVEDEDEDAEGSVAEALWALGLPCRRARQTFLQ